MNALAPCLSVRDLRLGYQTPAGLLTAVDGVSFDLYPGETFALLGESGCGKSASALGLLRLLPAAGRVLGGKVYLGEDDVLTLSDTDLRRVRGGRMAMIFQEPATSLNPVLTVGQQINEVLQVQRGLVGDAARSVALDLLAQVGIAEGARRLDEYPFQFSGGMKQRVMIAMALAGEPDVLIADEPTTALDVTVQAQILELLASLQAQRQMAMLLISHDLGVLSRMADRVGVMYAGELVEVAPRAAFFSRPAHPYSQALFAAMPEAVARGVPLQALPGQVPALAAMPTGCRFAERCDRAEARCREMAPSWQTLSEGHQVRCWLASDDRLVAPSESPVQTVSAPLSAQPVVLSADNVEVHFPIRKGLLRRVVGQVKAVDGVSLSLQAGRTLAVVGESGCGKTTLGKALLQLIPMTGGQVTVAGQRWSGLDSARLRPLRQHMQMVFQDPFGSLNPRLRIEEILFEGMQALGLASTLPQARPVLTRLLGQVGLDASALQRFPHEFSGGQRQRIAIARALAVQPKVLICDEPTSALDVSVQAQILNLLKTLQRDLGLAYVFITHNFAVVQYLADDVAVMYQGRIVEQGPAEQVLTAPQHAYTRTLLAAVPTLQRGE